MAKQSGSTKTSTSRNPRGVSNNNPNPYENYMGYVLRDMISGAERELAENIEVYQQTSNLDRRRRMRSERRTIEKDLELMREALARK